MPDPEPLSTTERSSVKGARPSQAPPSSVVVAGDSPTVVRGAGSGGSSMRRAQPTAFAPPLPLPQPGYRIDSFELMESIGVGGMGAVFLARDVRLDRSVALKILPPEQAHDPEVVQRFYQEGKAAARLDHENIARVYTIGSDDRYHFIAFEYIEGTTIRQRVEEDGPLSVSEAINYTLQIATALVHACERGVVHRDIKPSNIIVTPQGRAKLVDMGLARRFERGHDDGLTQSGMTLGTFDYISPEQARDPRDVDVRSDLYSLGCTLFHMLTGRPPFPEGTVLQKLIQHQEEPPPDIRALNPAVPPDLASILTKLMAKDRDRRYQTPEQLVRDLLILAGALGLRSVSPEGLIWMTAARAPAWERHLVWGIPALVFAVVLSGLAWWSQDQGGTASTAPAPSPLNLVRTAPPRATEKAPDPAPAVTPGPAPPSPAGEAEPAAAVPRELSVNSDDDLSRVLATAPPRSVIVLADDGPYTLGGEGQGPARLVRRDLTVKADVGLRPVLRLARAAGPSGPAPRAILGFLGGHVTLEGLEFVLDGGDREDSAAVWAEDTELTLRRCLFRHTGPRSRRGRVAALHVRSEAAAGGDDRPASVLADACHFDPGQAGVLAEGPVDLQFRDCTIAAADPGFWFANDPAAAAVPVSLRLRHDSVLAGEGPVFRFQGTDPRVWVEDSVIAPSREAEATLVATDNPDGLDWRGRSNLYSKIGVFLKPTGPQARREVISDPRTWAETANLIRETASVFTRERVWEEADPAQALAQEGQNPTRVFRVMRAPADSSQVGARQGPFGLLAPAPRTASSAPEAPPERRPLLAANAGKDGAPAPPAVSPPTATPANPPTPRANPEPAVPTPEMPEMPLKLSAESEGGNEPVEEGAPPTTTRAGNENRPRSEPATPPAAEVKPEPSRNSDTDPSVLRTAEQFVEALRQPEPRSHTVRVAAGADWELPGLTVKPGARWAVHAEPGKVRPRFRFRPGPGAPKGGAVLFEVQAGRAQAGSLLLDGVDIILPGSGRPEPGLRALFGVRAGANLTLNHCTITVEGEQTAFVVEPPGGDDGAARGDPPVATVRLTDSLARTGGDLIDVAPGCRLDLDLSNAAVGTHGSLVHAHGQPRGKDNEPVTLVLALRQVTARTEGGLLQLESAPGEPDLPVAEVSARDSVLATTPQGEPLFRVDGQDALSALQDRIVWEGHRVAYHQIDVYRRDQTAQVGAVPKTFDRPSWTVAVAPNEEDPVHGDLKFVRDWDPDRPSWSLRRDDLKLAPDSPARPAGADLQRIPDAPDEAES